MLPFLACLACLIFGTAVGWFLHTRFGAKAAAAVAAAETVVSDVKKL